MNGDVAKSGYLSNHLNSGPMQMDINADTYADGMMLVLCRCTSRLVFRSFRETCVAQCHVGEVVTTGS